MLLSGGLDHVEPIPGCPRLFERETAQSYLGRLATYFGYRSTNDFCNDFGLKNRLIHFGDEAALRHLATLTNADAEQLVRWTPTRVDRSRYRLGNVESSFDIGPRAHVLQCPVCARENIAQNPDLPPELCLYDRAEWSTGYFGACPVHKLRLVKRETALTNVEHLDSVYVRAGIYEDLDFIENDPAEPTAFELHALSVIFQKANPTPFIASLTLDTLFRLSKALGTDIANGEGLLDADDRTIQNLGFNALASGPEALHKVFVETCSRLPARFKAQHIVPHTLSALSRNSRPDMVRFRSMVVDLLFHTFPAKPGQKLAGINCKQRWIHTFESARLAYEIPSDVLHEFAKGTPGLATRMSENRDHILIDKTVADALFVGRTPLTKTGHLFRYFGSGNAALWISTLVEAGVLTGPLQDVALARYAPVFSKLQVEKEIADFLSPYVRVQKVPAGMISPRSAVAQTKISLLGIVTLIARRRLSKVVVLDKVPMMDCIHLDRDELLQVLTGNDGPMTKTDAAAFLGINALALIALMREGWLKPILPSVEGIKCNLAEFLARSDLEAFKARYLRPSDTSSLLGGLKSRETLVAQGLAPAIFLKLERLGSVSFYDRYDIDQFLERQAA